MVRFEDIAEGCQLAGVVANDTVTVTSIKRYGASTAEIVYKTSTGVLETMMAYAEDAASFSLVAPGLRWDFSADGETFRLCSEAWRIHNAHLFDPYLAVHTSSVEPLPHQISAVYKEMLTRLPLRYVIADDPGAGKTIMAGLLVKELIARGDLHRCLIVSPGNLAEQWQDELFTKFGIRFDILTNERIQSATGNVFEESSLLIARLDKLARNEELQQKLERTDWDLVVCDEAHKMSATVWGGEVTMTKRYTLGQLLSRIARNFLLLTATPHNGKEEDFQLFLALIDQDRFAGVARTGHQAIDVSDVMRRMVKEDLRKFDGSPLFPERFATTIDYDLSPEEAALYEAVTQYVRDEFNRADKLANKRKTMVGFALTVLQRRLASSPEAIWKSLTRRLERLEHRLAEEKRGRLADAWFEHQTASDGIGDDDDLPSQELEAIEDEVADKASAATTIAELEAEIANLRGLEFMARELNFSGKDRKWEELSGLLQDNEKMFEADGTREKIIIFTEHKDTLKYLARRIATLLGDEQAVVTISGGMLREERHKVEARFLQDKVVRVLVATDAAGEGLNLQRAHLMVNYDLPWNPNRIEQRFGRIHRIGQTKACWLWNLVAAGTREGMVFQKLFAKLEQERQALGGKVFDVLGKVKFNNRPLRELLIDAVRHGEETAEDARIHEVLDAALDHDALLALAEERALTQTFMDPHALRSIRESMERMEARKLQPHFVETFFMEAFKSLDGKVRPREEGRWEITHVPYAVRQRDMRTGNGESVLPRYERICFDKKYRNPSGGVAAALICPGHPLLEAVSSIIRERNKDVIQHGAVLIDDEHDAGTPRLLFSIENSIRDDKPLSNGERHIISRHIDFIEVDASGVSSCAGYAPYLDYRPATDEERNAVLAWSRKQAWLRQDIQEKAMGLAVEKLTPAHLAEVRQHREALLAKTEKAVKERLTAEIQYWDFRAGELKDQEAVGKKNAHLNSQQASRRAEDLERRLHDRLDELANEKKIKPLPPNICGGALVVPASLVNQLLHRAGPAHAADAESRRDVELKAMNAVMEIERSLGYEPRDVSADKCGYDVESAIPDGHGSGTACLRFIEVKGRAKGADTVTVSRNEMLTAFNRADQFFLAIVEVDGVNTRTVYLRNPFAGRPEFCEASRTFYIDKLMQHAEKVYEA